MSAAMTRNFHTAGVARGRAREAVRATILAAAIAALAGCSFIPKYERPALPVSADYPSGPAYGGSDGAANGAANGAAAPSATAVSAADIGWHDFFTDAELQDLIRISLANNRDLRVAALNVQAAQAQYRIQRADLLPTIGVGATETAARTPADLSRTGVTSITHQYQVGAVLSAWEIDLFGRIRSLSQEALELYLAQDETRTATQLSLVSEVANAYLTLRADQELLHLTQDTLKSQRNSYDLTKQSFDQGVATALDLAQAEVSVRTAERNQSQYLRQVAQDTNALVLLLGQPLPAEVQARLEQPGKLEDALMTTALPAGLPSDLLERRPDIRSAEHSLKAANADIGAARAAFFPTISLTGDIGAASSSLGRLFKGGQGAWSFVPQITTPIFAGGSLRASLDLSKIQKQIQVATYEQTIQTAFREVADALAGRGTLDEQIQAQQLLVDANQRAYDLSQQRFRQGIDNYLSVLDSQRSLYESQQILVQTRLARLSNLVTLYTVLGGGWSENTVPPQAQQAQAAAQ
jgi:multidrug efflux system outer membrane protein